VRHMYLHMVKDPRKRKSTLSQRKKQVKQSATKKQKRGLKYRNADLRVSLDSQAQEIFAMAASPSASQPLESSEEAVHTLERTMQDLWP